MKNFIKGRWFPLTIVILIVATVAIVMALFGWRITYAPELESSWDAISAVASLVGAVGAIAAMCFSVFALGKEIKLSQQQQRQNAALNLYPKRREALRLFSEGKYDEMYWDATILFSSEIVDKITNVSLCKNQLDSYCSLIEEYQNKMKNERPDLYNRFQSLVSQEHIQEDHNELLELCDQFKPMADNTVNGERILLDYGELATHFEGTRYKYQGLHNDLFLIMKNEIKKSIQ